MLSTVSGCGEKEESQKDAVKSEDSEAPALIVSGVHIKTEGCRTNPGEQMNIRVPIRSSNQSPIYMKAYIFISKWKAPMREAGYGAPPISALAVQNQPPISVRPVEGSRIPTPKATIKIKTVKIKVH